MDLLEGQAEALADGDDKLGQHGAAVGIEEAVESPADGVVGEPLGLELLEPEGAGSEGLHGLLLPVDGLTLNDDRAEEDAQGAGGIERLMDPGTRNEAGQPLRDPQPVQVMVDQGKRPQPLAANGEKLSRLWRTHATLPLDISVFLR